MRRRTLALRVPLFYTLQMKRTHDILGLPYTKLSKKERKIYDNLHLPDDTDGDNLEERVIALFADYLHYRENNNPRPKWLPEFHLFAIPSYVSVERSNTPSLFKDGITKGDAPFFLNLLKPFTKDHSAYIEKTFGKNLFSDEKSLALNRAICTEGHRLSLIHI